MGYNVREKEINLALTCTDKVRLQGCLRGAIKTKHGLHLFEDIADHTRG